MKTASKWHVLMTVVAGAFIGALNSSIVNVSIPALMRTFNAGLHQVEWVVTAFMIAFAVTMPLTSWLKERLSYRLLFVLSLAVFSFGSFLCGFSDSIEMLIFSRIVQAIGGGALGPISMAIIADTFPAPERGRAFGIWGLGVVIGPAIGPVLGGYLSEAFSWRWIFYINIPMGLVASVMGWRYLHRKTLETTHRAPFDLYGFVSITASTVSLLYALGLMAENGVTALSLGLLVVAGLSLFLFVRAEKSAEAPLWDLSLFRNRVFVSCVAVTMARSIALFGGVFLLPLILQGQMHLSESHSGLVMMPGSLILAFMMPVTGLLSDKGYTRSLTISGLLILAASFIAFAWVEPNTSVWIVTLMLLIRGIGIGLLVTPVSVATMSSVSHSQSAMASSISNVAQQVGGSFGIALLVLAKIFFESLGSRRGLLAEASDLYALHCCFLLAGGIVLLSLKPASHIR